MSDELELMTKYLVQLQFYSEEDDILFSRDKKQKLSINGIGPVIAAFENTFVQNLDLIRKKQFRAFLDAVAKVVPFDVETVVQDFKENVHELGSENLTDELSANFLIGPIRASIQGREFDACIYEIKKEALQKLDGNNSKVIVESRISDFFSRNDPTVSMLHNLAFLKYLTELFGSDETKQRVKTIFDEYCIELIAKLSN